MQTLLEGLFNEGSLQRTEEEDRTQWTHAQESMMEVDEECSPEGRQAKSERVYKNRKLEKGQLGLLRSLKYVAPAHHSVEGKRTSGSRFFLQSGGVGTV